MTEQETVCAHCGKKRGTNDMYVESVDRGKQHVNLCDICYPDFWDECAPDDFVRLDHMGIEVCQPYLECEVCSSVYPHGLVKRVLNVTHEPPQQTIVCSVCRRKYKDDFQE